MSLPLFLASPQTLIHFPPNHHHHHHHYVSNKIRHRNHHRRIQASISSRTSHSRNVDIATLGNLCIDIVLDVPNLPPDSLPERKAFMEDLSSSPPDKKCWEAGGHCNTAIAASRLGLHCVAIGNVGSDQYGNFLMDVLHNEGVDFVRMSDDPDATMKKQSAFQTLHCWVLVDSLQRHGFCSPADFLDRPPFAWINELSSDVKMTIRQSKILVVNGFGFDELSPGLMVSALKYAVEVGTCVFFDPGPKGRSISTGSPEKQTALSEYMKMSDIVLVTSEEAESLTGIGNPILAGQELLKQGLQTKWVIIKIGSKGSVLVTSSGTCCVSSFKVKVIDTVGCGDSFVAAIAFGFVHRMPMIHTLTIANAVGASTAMGSGGGRNVATFAKIMELIEAGDFYEDEEFWTELLDECAGTREITLLSKKAMTGVHDGLNIVPLERILPELASKLEST